MKKIFLNNQTITAIAIFALTFVVYISTTYRDYDIDLNKGTYRRLMPAADVIPNTFLPYSIIENRTLNFDEMVNTLKLFDGNKKRPYFLINTQEHYYSVYPIITGLMAVPFYLVPLLLNKIPELTYHENILKVLVLGRVTASFYAAASVSLMYLILRQTSNRKYLIFLFVAFYAYGTNTYSTSSRGLWLHTSSQFFISIALLLTLISSKEGAVKSTNLIPYLGFFLGIATITRPTNLILALILTVFVFRNHKQYFKKFIIAAVPSVIFLLLYNYYIFGSPFIEGYGARNDFNWTTPLTESIPAYIFSPARSYLFISTPLVFGFYTIVKVFFSKDYGGKNNNVYKYLSVSFILFFITYAKWYTWHGAPGFGNRMFSDFLPIIGLLSFETIKKFSKTGVIILTLMVVYSVYVHFNAVYFRKSRCSLDHNWSLYCLMPPKEKAQY